jgi:hypothetical protein
MDIEEFLAGLRSGEKPISLTTLRSTVRTGIPGVLDSHRDGRCRMLVPAPPGS